MPPFVTSDAPIPKLKKEYTSTSQPSGSLGTSLCCKNDFITHDREIRQPQQWHMAAGESFYQLPTWLSPPSKSRPSPQRLLLHCSSRLWQPQGKADLVRVGGEEDGRREKRVSANHVQALRDPSSQIHLFISWKGYFLLSEEKKASSALPQIPNL